jgi:hypothetical protein
MKMNTKLHEDQILWGVRYRFLIPNRGFHFAPNFYERRAWALAYKRRLNGNSPKSKRHSTVVKVRRIIQEL